MPFSTYTELKAAIADNANRTDLTTQIVDFITLAEARLNDDLLMKNYESEESLTLTQNQNYVALPTGYISDIAFWLIVDTQRILLEKALPQQLPYYPTSGQPRYWAIDGANIRFDVPAQEAYTAKFRMVKASNLGASVATNYLLTRRPDLYLSASMVELARFTKDVELFNAWESVYVKAKAGYMAAENRSREVNLRTDLPVRGRSNILLG
jgi:hypothetical protein